MVEIRFQVRKQVQSLRTIISGLQAKSKERQWLKNQTQGELDDMRLIEGITGEKSIYKKRGEQVGHKKSGNYSGRLKDYVNDVGKLRQKW